MFRVIMNAVSAVHWTTNDHELMCHTLSELLEGESHKRCSNLVLLKVSKAQNAARMVGRHTFMLANEVHLDRNVIHELRHR